ncbi:MAG: tandem-95 repeat protein, partial [Planctomycetales bacterium]|nr:tandem-95 repeat protein [Planctomycetales bacterium]
LTVDAVNDGPDASDDAYTTDEDTPLTTGNVLTNDTDLDGDTLTVDSFTQPAHGSVTYNGDGTFTYTPADNYHGDDSFTYTVSDGHGGTDTATIDLTVDAVNDAPVAEADSYSTQQGVPLTTGDVLANDTDLDGPLATIGDGLLGHWSLDADATDSSGHAADGELQGDDGDEFTAGLFGGGAADFDGVDDLIHTVDNGSDLQLSGDYSTSVWINPDANQKEWAGIYAKTDPSGGTNHWNLQFDNNADRNLVVMHDGNNRWDTGIDLDDVAGDWHHVAVVRSGSQMSVYLDGSLVKQETFAHDPRAGVGHLNIGAERTGSSSYLYAGQIDELRVYDRVLSADELNVLAASSTPAAFSVTGYEQPEHGTVMYNGDGTFTYTPDAGFSGVDTFEYTVTDMQGGTATAEVSITVQPVEQPVQSPGNDAPAASVDQGLAVAADESAANDAGIGALGGGEHARRLGETEAPRPDDVAASRSAQPAPSYDAGGFGGGQPSAEVLTEVTSSDDLDGATYIHTRAEANHPGQHVDGQPAESGDVRLPVRDDHTTLAATPTEAGVLASLWGLLRALGGTWRADESTSQDKSRDETTARR